MKTPSVKVLILASAVVWASTGATAYYVGKASADALVKAAIAKAGKSSSKGGAGQAALELALQNGGLAAYMGKDGAKGISLESLLKTPGKIDPELLALWAASLNPKDLGNSLASLQKLPVGSQRDSLMTAVVSAWAKKDPNGYLSSASGIPNPRLREQGINDALKAMATEDPQSALKWIKDNPGTVSNNAMQQRMAAAVAGFAANDPEAAFAYVNSLPTTSNQDAQLRQSAMQAMMQGIAAKGAFTDAVAMFAALPDGRSKTQLNNALLSQWAQASPSEAAAWVATMGPGGQTTQMNQQIANAWAQSDPAGAAKWAAQMDLNRAAELAANNPNAGGPNARGGPGGRGGNLLANTINTWSQYDLDGPAQFLNQMPPSTDKDNAVASYVRTASQEDPAGAMGWVGTITDPRARSQAVLSVAQNWQQVDPQGLNNFLATTDMLTPQQKQAIANGNFFGGAPGQGNFQGQNPGAQGQGQGQGGQAQGRRGAGQVNGVNNGAPQTFQQQGQGQGQGQAQGRRGQNAQAGGRRGGG